MPLLPQAVATSRRRWMARAAWIAAAALGVDGTQAVVARSESGVSSDLAVLDVARNLEHRLTSTREEEAQNVSELRAGRNPGPAGLVQATTSVGGPSVIGGPSVKCSREV